MLHHRRRKVDRRASLVAAIAIALIPIVGVANPAGAADTPDYGDMAGRRLTTPVVGFAARPQGDRRDYLYEGSAALSPPAPSCLLLPAPPLHARAAACLYWELGRWRA